MFPRMSGGTHERDAAPDGEAGKPASSGGTDTPRKDAAPDEEATVRMPAARPDVDADATIQGPLPIDDPDATVSGPLTRDDPDATVSGPLVPDDPEATLSGPVFAAGPDPDATVTQPALRPAPGATAEDPDATVRGALPAPDADDTDTSFRPADLGLAPPGKRNPFAPLPATEAMPADLDALGGLNPLVAAAAPLLSAATHLRALPRHPSLETLQERLGARVHAFEADLATTDLDAEIADAACFALCALIDEAAASAPWGEAWPQNGMAVQVYGVAADPDRVFTLIESHLGAPDAHRDLLELLYLCLSLGYEGRHRGTEAGPETLAVLRARLHSAIRRPRSDRALASASHGASPTPAPQSRAAPLWAAAIAALLALGIHQMFSRPATVAVPLASVAPAAQTPVAAPAAQTPVAVPAPQTPVAAPAPQANVVAPAPATPVAVPKPEAQPGPQAPVAVPVAPPAVTQPAAAAPPAAAAAPASSPAPVATPKPVAAANPAAAPKPADVAAPRESVRARLAGELDRKLVRITESGDRTTIELRENHQFASGAVEPAASIRPLLARIAEALDPLPGAIVVLGHADPVPIRSGAHASNDALSLARAKAASALMAEKLSDPARLRSEGRGDRDLIDTGTSSEARAHNRRVVIVHEARP